MIKKQICIALLALTVYPVVQATQETKAYICKGPKSTKYHYSKNCRGLNRCSTHIYKTTESEAKRAGRTLCGWED